MEDINDIWQSIREIEHSLKLAQRETQSLGEGDSKKPKEQKKTENFMKCDNRAQSAWAKSTVPSTASIVGLYSKSKLEIGQYAIISLDSLVHSDNVLYTSKPSHNFGLSSSRASKSTTELADLTIPGPTTYHYTDKGLSNKRRPRSATMLGSARKSLFVNTQPPSHTPTTNNPDNETATEPNSVIEYEFLIAGGSSFGKANRFPETIVDENSTPQTILNVEKSLKTLETHVPTAVIIKPPPKETHIETVPTSPSPVTVLDPANIKVLSHRIKAPTVRFTQPTSRDPKFLIISKTNHGQIPGPNHYSIEETALRRTQQGSGIHTGMHLHYSLEDGIPTSSDIPGANAAADGKKQHYRKKQQEEKELESLRGPGCYDLPSTDIISNGGGGAAGTGGTGSGTGILKFVYSDNKDTKALKLKHYYEQKAAEMRDYHDDMQLSTVDRLYQRVPVVRFAPSSIAATKTIKKSKQKTKSSNHNDHNNHYHTYTNDHKESRRKETK